MATTAEDLTAETTEETPVVSLTPEAHRIVREALDQEPEPASLALWLEVRGVQEGNFVYDLYFQATSDAADEDAVHHDGDIPVVVPAGSVDRLRGARLEWSEDGNGGLVLVNPNTPTVEERSPGVPPGDPGRRHHRPAGPARRRRPRAGGQPLHCQPRWPGRPDRARCGQGFAYLRLSGGCQGCAMSQMTLRAGHRDHVARRGARTDQGDRCDRSR